MDLGDVVQWDGAHEGTWSWPGKAKILSYDPNRIFFEGNKVPQGQICRGPAIELVLDHNQLRVWVSPDEVSPYAEKKAAVFQ
jgi:hypothetical protein